MTAGRLPTTFPLSSVSLPLSVTLGAWTHLRKTYFIKTHNCFIMPDERSICRLTLSEPPSFCRKKMNMWAFWEDRKVLPFTFRFAQKHWGKEGFTQKRNRCGSQGSCKQRKQVLTLRFSNCLLQMRPPRISSVSQDDKVWIGVVFKTVAWLGTLVSEAKVKGRKGF